VRALTQEVNNVQNPALGAGLLWRFSCGYVGAHKTSEPVPLPLLFLVLPILFHEQTSEFVKNTQKASGMRAFTAKFGESKTSKQDLLLAIHDRAIRFRALTTDSLQLALATRLLHLELEGRIVPLSMTAANTGFADETKELIKAAEKLGYWCAFLTLHEIATTLKVRF
jgi:hypothetical protein